MNSKRNSVIALYLARELVYRIITHYNLSAKIAKPHEDGHRTSFEVVQKVNKRL